MMFLFLFSLFFSLLFSLVLAQSPCTLACSFGSTCVFGEADFSAFLAAPFDLAVTNINGMHCDCQLREFTGLLCDVPVDPSCPCFFGGSCLSGGCDCSFAFFTPQGFPAIGQYCEYDTSQATTTCPPNNNNNNITSFCLNNGTCNSAFGPPCLCPAGFEGAQCELVTGRVPSCDLACMDGGYCALSLHQGRYVQTCVCPPGLGGTMCQSPVVDSCPIGCGTFPCLMGPLDAPFDAPFLETMSGDFHCECPLGWTGVLCNHPYIECPDHGLLCFHGGQCISNQSSYCDCSTASSQYVGKRCGISLPSSGSPCASGTYCVHGGICNSLYPGSGPPCYCPPGYEGAHCEYVTGSVPHCDLSCANGGYCILSGEEGPTCVCPSGFIGPLCNETGTTCEVAGRDCLNNGTCIEEVGFCDCPPLLFGGTMCQYPATTLCPENYACFQGGSCGVDSMSCNCPASFFGSFCQYRVDDPNDEYVINCDLFCFNGGVCAKGIKPLSVPESRIGFLSANRYNDAFEHCLCPNGYTGLQCEFRLEVCQGDQRACLFGSKCQLLPNGSYGCDCRFSSGLLAGDACEFAASSVCIYPPTTAATVTDRFCVNGGVCRALVSPFEPHPGCDCPLGFTGSHCQVVTATSCLTNNGGTDHNLVCYHGGVCRALVSDSRAPHPGCNCPNGFGGTRCEIIVDGITVNDTNNFEDDNDDDLFSPTKRRQLHNASTGYSHTVWIHAPTTLLLILLLSLCV